MGKLRILKKGSLVGIAALSSPFKRKKFARGLKNLKRAGFRSTYHPGIFSKGHYLAGTDRRRALELKRLFKNPKVEAILFARGGYGCARALKHFSKKDVRFKVVMGFSDLTVLLGFLWKQFRIPSLYGPMVASQLRRPRYAKKSLRVLTDKNFLKNQNLRGRSQIRPGRARGTLVGGCLCLLSSTLGTPFEIETRGSILFIEDTNEDAYAIDRMLTQLIHAGKLKGVRGIILGSFDRKGNNFPLDIKKVFEDRLKKFKGPVLWGVHFGHMSDPKIIPYGGIAKIIGKKIIIERGIF